METALADGSALVGILAEISARGCNGGNGDHTALHTVVPQVVVGPAGGGAGVEDNTGAGKDGLFRHALYHAIDGNLLGHHVGGGITADGNGKRLVAHGSVLCGVADAIDVAAVGLDSNLSRGLACAPLPLAAILCSFRQLWHERDVAAISGDALRRTHLILVFQATKIGLVLIGHTFI